jgi:hypothetical protein
MMDQQRDKARGFALFCDDARVEVGGKLSLMGLIKRTCFFQATCRSNYVAKTCYRNHVL